MKIIVLLFLASACLIPVSVEAYPDDEVILDRIDIIEIHVISKIVIAINLGEDMVKVRIFQAATASPKNAVEMSHKNPKGIPYGKIGEIWKIVLNPVWIPPDSIREEDFTRKGIWLPREIPPGKNNPLGIAKLFISFDEINSLLGIHNTNNPRSIGKRVTHGCTRMEADDISLLAEIILKQNGYDPDEIFRLSKENPKKQFSFKINDRPKVVHFKD